MVIFKVPTYSRRWREGVKGLQPDYAPGGLGILWILETQILKSRHIPSVVMMVVGLYNDSAGVERQISPHQIFDVVDKD